jgi:hypothetical protein
MPSAEGESFTDVAGCAGFRPFLARPLRAASAGSLGIRKASLVVLIVDPLKIELEGQRSEAAIFATAPRARTSETLSVLAYAHKRSRDKSAIL